MLVQGGYGQIYGGGGAGVGARLAGNASRAASFRRRVQLKQLQLQERSLDMQETQMYMAQQNADRQALLARASQVEAAGQFDRQFALSARQSAHGITVDRERLDFAKAQFEQETEAAKRRDVLAAQKLADARTEALAQIELDSRKEYATRADKARIEANKLAEANAQPGQPYTVTLATGEQATVRKPFSYDPREEQAMRDARGQLGSLTDAGEAIARQRELVQKKLEDVSRRIAEKFDENGDVLPAYAGEVKQLRQQQEALQKQDDGLQKQFDADRMKAWEAEVRLGWTRTQGAGDAQLLSVIGQHPGLPAALARLGAADTVLQGKAADLYRDAIKALESPDPRARLNAVNVLVNLAGEK